MSTRNKRRSRSPPPESKRTAPGTPGPFTDDVARADRQNKFPGASPKSVQKVLDFRTQLFMKTRGQEAAASQASQTSMAATSTGPPSEDAQQSEMEFTALPLGTVAALGVASSHGYMRLIDRHH